MGSPKRIAHFLQDMSSDNVQIRGNSPHGTGDTGEPVKVGGVARRSNPTAVEDGDRVDDFRDDVGRPVMTMYQVRDLLATGSATLDTGAAVSILAGVSGEFHDLLEITCANQSDAVQSVSLRDATNANVLKTLELPANDTRTFTFPATLPQNEADSTWTAQNAGSDVSNTTVAITATFAKNV